MNIELLTNIQWTMPIVFGLTFLYFQFAYTNYQINHVFSRVKTVTWGIILAMPVIVFLVITLIRIWSDS